MEKASSIILFFIMVVVIITPSISYAARLLSTDDAGVVKARHMEVEAGFEYVKQADKENNLTLCIKYGLIEKLDLGVEVPYQFIDISEGNKVEGIGDIQITTKYNFLDETETLPALALSCVVKTKTGDTNKGLGSGEIDYSLNGIITKEIGDFTTHANLGYTFVGEPESEDLDDIFSYGLSVEYPLIESLNMVGEITGETTFDGDFDDNPFSGLIGFNCILNKRLCFDVGIGFQISKASPDYKIVTGLTLAF